MINNREGFGKAVVPPRTASGLSQEAVDLGASIGRSNMSAIENGRSVPNLVGVVKIAASLGCSFPMLARELECAHKELVERADSAGA